MPPAVPLSQIVELVRGRYDGPEAEIAGVAPLSDAGGQQLAFLSNPKYAPQLETTRAAAVLVANDLPGESPSWIRVANPYEAMARVLARFFAHRPMPVGISEKAAIASTAKLGRDVAIGAFTSIGEEVTLGDGVVIFPNVTIEAGSSIGDGTIVYPQVSIYHGTKIGRRCIVHSGVVIGADGFGFAPDSSGTRHKIPQVGIVRIEDDVEIGAGSTIDRAALGETVIGEGTKIDNLVQIGHNVKIGRHCVLVSQVGIAGSTELGDYVIIGGQSGLGGHIKIASGVEIAGKSAVFKSVKEKKRLRGIPAVPIEEWTQHEATLRRLSKKSRKSKE